MHRVSKGSAQTKPTDIFALCKYTQLPVKFEFFLFADYFTTKQMVLLSEPGQKWCI